MVRITKYNMRKTYKITPEMEQLRREKISKTLKGFKRPPFSAEHIEKMRKNSTGKKMSEKNKLELSERMKGNKYKVGSIMSEQNKEKARARKPNLGIKLSEETIKKMVKTKKERYIKENHYNWKGGIALNPYPTEFNRALKLKIRTRDNFVCILCKKTEREELEELNRVLCVNHIDFNKNNCSENNLNTLCTRCNIKINRERDYWTNYFQNYGQ